MPKRLMSINEIAEAILNSINTGQTKSGFVSAAIIDEKIPVYSVTLRKEARNLLEYMADKIDSNKDNMIRSPKNASDVSYDQCKLITMQAVVCGVSWLRDHHIHNPDVLDQIVSYYHLMPEDGGISTNELPESVRDDMRRIRQKMRNVNDNYIGGSEGLGILAKETLDHWQYIWDDNDAYNIIISMIRYEKTVRDLNAITVIQLLQDIETQYIVEQIKY